MMRFNNAPPPQTPWREEVLKAKKEAQRQIEKARGGGSRSRSRSRSRGGGGGGRKQTKEEKKAASAAESGAILRQARERGEGWFAAVARASERWDSVAANKKPPKLPGSAPAAPVPAVAAAIPAVGGFPMPPEEVASSSAKRKEQPKPGKKLGKETDKRDEKRNDSDDDERSRREDAVTKAKTDAERLEQEKQRLEFEMKAEQRRLKAEEERRKAEHERMKTTQLKKQREERLKGAFAFGDSDDDAEDQRAAMARKAQEKRRGGALSEAPLGVAASMAPASAALALASSSALAVGPPKGGSGGTYDPVMSERIGFEAGLSPAEAFMRLSERKRKGRRAEFGGPPRGTSPWRDGKQGISFEKKNKND